jgi:hypothetical protein
MSKNDTLLQKKNHFCKARALRDAKAKTGLHIDNNAAERCLATGQMIGRPSTAASSGASVGDPSTARHNGSARWTRCLADLQGRVALPAWLGWVGASFMLGEIYNLIAAVLSTIGAAFCCLAMFLSEPSFVNILAGAGAGIGVLGGVAWTAASIVAIRQKGLSTRAALWRR